MGTIFDYENTPRSPAETRLRDLFNSYITQARICAAYTRRPAARYEPETLTLKAARQRLSAAADALEAEVFTFSATAAGTILP